MDGVSIGEGAYVRRAILDKNVVVPARARIGVDLAADRERYHVSAGGVTVLGKGARADRDRMPAPLVVTLLLDDAAQARFDRLRPSTSRPSATTCRARHALPRAAGRARRRCRATSPPRRPAGVRRRGRRPAVPRRRGRRHARSASGSRRWDGHPGAGLVAVAWPAGPAVAAPPVRCRTGAREQAARRARRAAADRADQDAGARARRRGAIGGPWEPVARCRSGALGRDEQAGADREDGGEQGLVVADRAGHSRRRRSADRGRWGRRSARPRAPRGGQRAADAQRRPARQVRGYSPAAAANDQVVGAGGEPGQDLGGRAEDEPGRGRGERRRRRRPLAARSCSGSPSRAVSTPSGRMPRSSHSPASPPPLPIDDDRPGAPTRRRARRAGRRPAGSTGGRARQVDGAGPRPGRRSPRGLAGEAVGVGGALRAAPRRRLSGRSSPAEGSGRDVLGRRPATPRRSATGATVGSAGTPCGAGRGNTGRVRR